jgi:hypothetical protein
MRITPGVADGALRAVHWTILPVGSSGCQQEALRFEAVTPRGIAKRNPRPRRPVRAAKAKGQQIKEEARHKPRR